MTTNVPIETDEAAVIGGATGAATLDAARVSLALGIVAVLTVGWLATSTIRLATDDPGLIGWVILFAACLGVLMAPQLAGVATARQAVMVSALGAGVVVLLAVLAHALALVPMSPLTVLTAAAGAVLALLARAALGPAVAPGAAAAAGLDGAGAADRDDEVAPAENVSEVDALIESSPGSTAGGAASHTAPRVAGMKCAPGVRIGRYTLESRIARGGMGEVWRARHDTLIRPAVLKLIRRQASADAAKDKELMERFRREAVATANLTSPHTVQLYDFGVEGQTLYIAMELLEAASLAGIVGQFGPLEEARVVFLLRQACHCLIEAHDNALVHRDIKPDNLLITRAGRDNDFLKVIDFGLVKELSGVTGKRRSTGMSRQMQLTALGARPGTPGYMAPEQIGGDSIDQRADIYALACVAYYCVTGVPVFEGSADAQLMFAHMQIEPEKPSARGGRPVHAGLEALIMRCLAKDPAARPQSMEELDRALAELAFELPWSQERARAWWTEERSQARLRAYETLVGA